jgi:hypothetical protein
MLGIHEYMQQRAGQLFKSEGASGSEGRWAALRPNTQRIRVSLKLPGISGPHPINRRTGDLQDLMTKEAPEIITTPESLTLQYPGTTAQSKGKRPKKLKQAQGGRGTARPVLQAGPTELAAIVGMADRFFTRGL